MALLWNRLASLPRRLRSWRLDFFDEYPATAGMFSEYPADPDGTTWRRVAPGLWCGSRVAADGSNKRCGVQFDTRVALTVTGVAMVGAASWRCNKVGADPNTGIDPNF